MHPSKATVHLCDPVSHSVPEFFRCCNVSEIFKLRIRKYVVVSLFLSKHIKYCQMYTAKCKVSTNKSNSCMGSLHWGHHWSSFYFANFGTRKNINFFYTMPKCLFFFGIITRHWVRGVTKKLQQTYQLACL